MIENVKFSEFEWLFFFEKGYILEESVFLFIIFLIFYSKMLEIIFEIRWLKMKNNLYFLNLFKIVKVFYFY